MPIDKRKMSTVVRHYTTVSSMLFSSHTLYLSLIFTSLAWNAYNTQQYRILAERQSNMEQILAGMDPSTVLALNPLETTTSTLIEQWASQARHFLRQFTSNDAITSGDHRRDSIAQSYTVGRISFGNAC